MPLDKYTIRSNYSTVIKSIQLYYNDPLKFTMHAQGVHVNNKIIENNNDAEKLLIQMEF